jgi:hypothetical protein
MLLTGRMSSGADGGAAKTATGGGHRRFCLRGPACRATGGFAKPGRGASAGYHRKHCRPISLFAWSASSGRPSPNCEGRKKRRKMGPQSYYETRHRPMSLGTRPWILVRPRSALSSVGACASCGPADAHRLALRLLTVWPCACSLSGPASAHRLALRLLTVRLARCGGRRRQTRGRDRRASSHRAMVQGPPEPRAGSAGGDKRVAPGRSGPAAARDPRPRRGRVSSLTADAGRPNPEVGVIE